MTRHDDLGLVRRLQDGDEQAFARFFDGYVQGLFRYAMARLGHRELAQDMVQATFLTAVRKLHTYRGDGSLEGWLKAVCRFEITAYLRRDARHEVGSLDQLQEVGMSLPDPRPGPERSAAQGQAARRLYSTLEVLPDHYRQVLEWKYAEGLPVREIATRLGVGEKAAESLLTRARGAFRSRYGSETPR